jgi:acyl carrier protein
MKIAEVVELYAQALRVPADQVDEDATLFRQGASSLRAAWLFGALRERFGVEIPKDRFWVGLTPREVLEFLPT